MSILICSLLFWHHLSFVLKALLVSCMLLQLGPSCTTVNQLQKSKSSLPMISTNMFIPPYNMAFFTVGILRYIKVAIHRGLFWNINNFLIHV